MGRGQYVAKEHDVFYFFGEETGTLLDERILLPVEIVG